MCVVSVCNEFINQSGIVCPHIHYTELSLQHHTNQSWIVTKCDGHYWLKNTWNSPSWFHRRKIYLDVDRTTSEYEYLYWVIYMVREKGVNTPKIIFCANINAMAKLYRWLRSSHDNSAFLEAVFVSDDVMGDMYHSHNDSHTRDVLSSCVRVDSTTRVVATTVALGMGVEIPDVHYIVHWGLGDCSAVLARDW